MGSRRRVGGGVTMCLRVEFEETCYKGLRRYSSVRSVSALTLQFEIYLQQQKLKRLHKPKH